MRFRPCIDIHNGKVKQIVGGSLRDEGDRASENFVSELDAADYARMYGRDGLRGGHIIMLNPASSPWYEATKEQAVAALHAAPGFFQIGGGINPENASAFLEAGASHVIVTSFVFRDGKIDYAALDRLGAAVGRERLVLDVSCRKRGDQFYVVTDRWQKFTTVAVTEQSLLELSAYCDEFLVHGVDVEGKQSGPDRELVSVLAAFCAQKAFSVTYAGGISSLDDIEHLKKDGFGLIDFTVGSALDLFGGSLSYDRIKQI